MTLKEYQDNPFAWPGGYQVNALMDDGEVLCHECCSDPVNPVHEDKTLSDGWQFVDSFIHWEGESLYCAHCNKELESEYGTA